MSDKYLQNASVIKIKSRAEKQQNIESFLFGIAVIKIEQFSFHVVA